MKYFSLANALSCVRGIVGLVIILLVLLAVYWPGIMLSYTSLLVIICLTWQTDWLDGLAARKGWWGSQRTEFGFKLDPTNDKILTAACVVVLLQILPAYYFWWFVFIFVFVEGFLNALLYFALKEYVHNKTYITNYSKVITLIQGILLTGSFLLLAINGVNTGMIAKLSLVFIVVSTLSVIRIICYTGIWLAYVVPDMFGSLPETED
jgi:phosphatidylglycerophosphate synthase